MLTNTTESNLIALENAALLANLWHGIEMDVKARNAARINKSLIETHCRENNLQADFSFIESEARGIGLTVAESSDKTAYIFRRQMPGLLHINADALKKKFLTYGEPSIGSADIVCPLCSFRFDEHPVLGSIEIERGSRFLRLIGRATCFANVLFEKAVEI